MGITVALQTERGEKLAEVLDPKNLLHRVLPQDPGSGFNYLSYIEWYGDTTFNRLQMTPFLAEWDRLLAQLPSGDVREFLEQIKRLALRCQEDVYLYLIFIGDQVRTRHDHHRAQSAVRVYNAPAGSTEVGRSGDPVGRDPWRAPS